MDAQLRVQDKINEAEQHLEVLEKTSDERKMWLPFYKERGKGTYDEAKDLINALDFAINFIKWGIGGKML